MSSSSAHGESPTHSQPSLCADCGAPLTGPFCSQCGEHVLDQHSLTLWHFFQHNLLHELSHIDGKIFGTFRYLLFRPGFLSAEYFAGRRRRYINPVRLLLTTLVIFALLPNPGSMVMSIGKVRLNLLPPGPPSSATIKESVGKVDVFGILANFLHRQEQRKDLKSEAAVEKFNHELKTYGTALSFSNVILLAAFLALLYHKRRPLFVEHLVFSLHLATFVILFSFVPGPLSLALVNLTHGSELQIAAGITAFSLISVEVIYLLKALLRFYYPETQKLRWRSVPAWVTLLTVVAIFFVNSVFITLTYAIGAAIALWRV